MSFSQEQLTRLSNNEMSEQEFCEFCFDQAKDLFKESETLKQSLTDIAECYLKTEPNQKVAFNEFIESILIKVGV
jgi:hypothetical protein